MTNATKILSASKYYSDLIASFSTNEKLKLGFNGRELSEAIYFHCCKMHYAGWRHRIDFKKYRKHSFSDYFQDIIAFYLRASLPKEYEVELERKRGNKYVFIIEVKTNVGWHRINENTKSGIEAIESIRTRCNDLAGKFEVDKQKIMYIFEEPTNVSKNFTAKYWDEDQLKPNPRPPNLLFSIIYPLFYKIDPYYWTWEKGFDPRKNYKEISDEQIPKMAKNSIVTPFEEILRIILKS